VLPGSGFEPLSKFRFGIALRAKERIAKRRIAGECLELGELAQIGNPPVADGFGDRIREPGVRQQ
jgi:hypothetical protein